MSEGAAIPAAELALGGGMISLSPLPGRGGRDLERDLAALRDWGADLLISLVEPQELTPDFGQAVARQGLGWRLLSIPDFGTPEGAELEAELPHLLTRLSAGERLAVHCMGGCGRSGMVVLRLMVLAGEPPEPALARLRAVRPCAVETPAQLEWATEGELRELGPS